MIPVAHKLKGLVKLLKESHPIRLLVNCVQSPACLPVTENPESFGKSRFLKVGAGSHERSRIFIGKNIEKRLKKKIKTV
jgi:hypothetical protein